MTTSPEPYDDPSVILRFWSKVSHSTDRDACWEWSGWRQEEMPYGQIQVAGRKWLTHRLSWVLHNHCLIPPGKRVLHKCDNPPCVNPRHLFLGTGRDNATDMVSKDRHPKAMTPKLTQALADEIREVYAAGGVAYPQLQARYGVARSTISRIINGHIWRTAP